MPPPSQGTIIIAPIMPPDTQDTYPTHKANYGLGGIHHVATLADRDAISVDRQQEGMLCSVEEDEQTYQLRNGVWVLFPDLSLNSIAAEDVSYTNPGYPTIAHVKAALDRLLYVAITGSLSGGSTNEVGTVITSLTLNWTLSKDPISQSLNQGLGAQTPLSLRTRSLTGLNITTNITYVLTASDGTTTITPSTTVSFLPRRHWGASTNPSLTSAQILALPSSELASSRNQTRTMAGNNEYLYFAWPASFGDPTFVVNGLTSTAWIKTVVNHTNALGFTQSYFVFRSTFLQNGSGIVVQVS